MGVGMMLLVTLDLLISALMATAVSQTDWSGGGGVAGPVTQWNDVFLMQSGIDFSASPGDLVLSLEAEETAVDEFEFTTCVCNADIDGDGDEDVIASSRSLDRISWFENTDGSGATWIEHVVANDFDFAASVAAEDLNNDGYIDIVGAASWDDELTWWKNTDGSGTSWEENTLLDELDAVFGVHLADINNDEAIDILAAVNDDDQIIWLQNSDTAPGVYWTLHIIDDNYDSPYSVTAGDVNDDGYMDVLSASELDNDVTWWENLDGTGTTWNEHVVGDDLGNLWDVDCGDMNGDGYLDVVSCSYSSDDLSWWENIDGTGTDWVEHYIHGAFDGVIFAAVEDIDLDGDLDVAAAAYFDNEISWFENIDGTGQFFTEHNLAADFTHSRTVCTGDLDGDGHPDITGGSFSGSPDIRWWRTGNSGILESSILQLDQPPAWQEMYWDSSEPVGTDIAFQVRSSDNSEDMGAWSESIHSDTSLAQILTDGDSLVQYRVIMSTSDMEETPVLEDITLSYIPSTSIAEEEPTGICDLSLHGTFPNPAVSCAFVRFSLPAAGEVELSVHDMSGRMVFNTVLVLPGGMNQVAIEGLNSGTYLIKMKYHDTIETERFILIE
ncbi:MAG: T9SS type A sorting domain-containing protein [Candidatus Aegiribacteria sp.]|nr:T9SS type A sorting domain-containing protein [Candidatus Aegiribacteria sp.]